MSDPILKAPFPWFGGKSRVAGTVWSRFGDVPNYVEPFYGSGAVLLGRPHPPGIETVNDADCYLSNFWRALQKDPAGVAKWADWPVNEADLHARHLWLVQRDKFRERMKTNPYHFDSKIAGWWVWGISQWIGGGWCSKPSWRGRYGAGAPRGIWRKRPIMKRSGAGVHRAREPWKARPNLTKRDREYGGRHRANGEPRRGRPDVKHSGVHASGRLQTLIEYFEDLATRLRKVRVCCGDWKRVLRPSPTFHIGLTAVFLDPPYSASADRDPDLYACEDDSVAHAVREWAIANGGNDKLRIALCGYEGEHDMPADWEYVAWKTSGGYAVRAEGRGKQNAHRERIWFSPHCLKDTQPDLFNTLPPAGTPGTLSESPLPVIADQDQDDAQAGGNSIS